MKFLEKMEAVDDRGDEEYARAAVDSEKCLEMLQAQSRVRRISRNSMMAQNAAFLVIVLMDVAEQLLSQHYTPSSVLPLIAFVAVLSTASYCYADMKVKLLKTLRAQQMQAQVLADERSAPNNSNRFGT